MLSAIEDISALRQGCNACMWVKKTITNIALPHEESHRFLDSSEFHSFVHVLKVLIFNSLFIYNINGVNKAEDTAVLVNSICYP